jgi:p25-alpha
VLFTRGAAPAAVRETPNPSRIPRLNPDTRCAGDLKRMFAEFAGFGSRAAAADMDGTKFFKLCKESKLLSKRFTAIDCDIIFAKAGLRIDDPNPETSTASTAGAHFSMRIADCIDASMSACCVRPAPAEPAACRQVQSYEHENRPMGWPDAYLCGLHCAGQAQGGAADQLRAVCHSPGSHRGYKAGARRHSTSCGGMQLLNATQGWCPKFAILRISFMCDSARRALPLSDCNVDTL